MILPSSLVILIIGLLLFLLVANPAVHIIGLVLLIIGAVALALELIQRR